MLPVSGAALLVAWDGKYNHHWKLGFETCLGSSLRATELLTHQAILQVGEASTLLVVALSQKHVP